MRENGIIDGNLYGLRFLLWAKLKALVLEEKDSYINKGRFKVEDMGLPLEMGGDL